MPTIKELSTKRLYLRNWRQSDYPAFAELNAGAAVMRHFPNTLDRTQSDKLTSDISLRINEEGWGIWAVELKSAETFIGFVGLNQPSYPVPFSPCVEIAWRLSQTHWNKGYATEAAQAALDFGFTDLKLEEIVSFTASSNQASQAVMKKLHMSLEKNTFLHPKLDPSHPLAEHVLYRLNKKDYFFRHCSQ